MQATHIGVAGLVRAQVAVALAELVSGAHAAAAQRGPQRARQLARQRGRELQLAAAAAELTATVGQG